MLVERLTGLIEPLVEDLGYELVLLEFVPQARSALLRLYIDLAQPAAGKEVAADGGAALADAAEAESESESESEPAVSGSESEEIGDISDSGIDVDDCALVSREVAALLDVEDPITQPYRLEVSSPGLDRPLTKPVHYQRFIGSQVRVQLVAPLQGRKRFTGLIQAVREDGVTLQTGAGEVELAFAAVERARLVPDFEKELGQKSRKERA